MDIKMGPDYVELIWLRIGSSDKLLWTL
jgi:hypothetical protein